MHTLHRASSRVIGILEWGNSTPRPQVCCMPQKAQKAHKALLHSMETIHWRWYDTGILLLSSRDWIGNTCAAFFRLIVTHHALGFGFRTINPAIPYSVWKLFFLTPHNALGKYSFSNASRKISFYHPTLACHLIFRIETHGHIHKLLI